MSITDYPTHGFRAEHRQIRDLALVGAFRLGDVARVRTLVSCMSATEGSMYPGLVPIAGQDHVAKLFTDHDGAIRELSEVSRAAGLDTERSIRLTRKLLQHVSDSDGLAVIAEDDVVHILTTVERDLDVPAGADQARGQRV
ncbi:hypothetical protein [Acrocarpospora catenulata]|uniref:hypothetical protein n=1 Tax=Acrocarpospora catenulata TaxID=2836182 RepID=UPI001BDAA4E6|nr:hypothetical protein [Acrocarpospora catenulata]